MLSIIIGVFFVAISVIPVSATNSQVIYSYYGFVEDPDNPWETDYDAQDETGTAEYSDDYFFCNLLRVSIQNYVLYLMRSP